MRHKDMLTDQPDFHALVYTLVAHLYNLANFHCRIIPYLDPKGLISEAEKVFKIIIFAGTIGRDISQRSNTK